MRTHPLNPKKPQGLSKVEEVRQGLYALAKAQGPDAQLPPVRALCTILNTTNTTLRDALDLLEAENILYRKERKGIYVSPKIHSRSLLVIMNPTLFTGVGASPFWNMLWYHLAQEAQQRSSIRNDDYTFYFANESNVKEGNPLPQEIIELIQTRHVHGCLIIGYNTRIGDWDALLPIPHVVFAGYGAWTILLDGLALGYTAVQSLIQRGCRRIGMWTGNGVSPIQPYFRPQDLREHKGLRQALAEANLAYYPELIRYPVLSTGAMTKQKPVTYQEQGYQLARQVMAGPEEERPDGVLITTDMLTDGVLVALDELDLQVGKDLQVATHANTGSPILFRRTQRMISIEFDPQEIAHTLFLLLDTLLAGQNTPDNIIYIQPQLRENSFPLSS